MISSYTAIVASECAQRDFVLAVQRVRKIQSINQIIVV